MSASREGAPESGHQQIFSLEESSHEAEQLAQGRDNKPWLFVHAVHGHS